MKAIILVTAVLLASTSMALACHVCMGPVETSGGVCLDYGEYIGNYFMR